jgi:hypothetical protein
VLLLFAINGVCAVCLQKRLLGASSFQILLELESVTHSSGARASVYSGFLIFNNNTMACIIIEMRTLEN